jgi:hypothetical protein
VKVKEAIQEKRHNNQQCRNDQDDQEAHVKKKTILSHLSAQLHCVWLQLQEQSIQMLRQLPKMCSALPMWYQGDSRASSSCFDCRIPAFKKINNAGHSRSMSADKENHVL